MTPLTNLDDYIDECNRLLEIEWREEAELCNQQHERYPVKQLERCGIAITQLQHAETLVGLGGSFRIKLQRRHNNLPATMCTVGDLVVVEGPDRDSLSTGVLTAVGDDSVTVSIDEMPDVGSFPEPLAVRKLPNDVTFRRYKKGLDVLRQLINGPASNVFRVICGEDPTPPPPHLLSADDLPFFNQNLDPSQRAAVAFALATPEIALIHGPPGTGKTTTVVELVRQAVGRGKMKVLVCAPSNVAVDNIVEKLSQTKNIAMVRLGHTARVLPHVARFSLDVRLAESDAAAITADVKADLARTQKAISQQRSADGRRRLRAELGLLRKELREREKKAMCDVLSACDVVLATNAGISDQVSRHLPDAFDMVIIDEAAQALEVSCWAPLLRGKKLVLAGDHRQLPPVVKSDAAVKAGLADTLFDRITTRHGETLTRMLTVQYRMHERIMTWSSEEMYQGKLEAHPSVAGHLLRDLPLPLRESNPLPSVSDLLVSPLAFVDTAGFDCEEADGEDAELTTRTVQTKQGIQTFETIRGMSKSNPSEVKITTAYVRRLAGLGVPYKDMAVITPYLAQVDALRISLREERERGLEIGTVDGFQGREKEAVVISLVRSNPKGEVGFLSDERRMNVAVTRARRHVCLVGDSSTMESNPFLDRLTTYFIEHGLTFSAPEFLPSIVASTHTTPLTATTHASAPSSTGTTPIPGSVDDDARRQPNQDPSDLRKPSSKQQGVEAAAHEAGRKPKGSDQDRGSSDPFATAAGVRAVLAAFASFNDTSNSCSSNTTSYLPGFTPQIAVVATGSERVLRLPPSLPSGLRRVAHSEAEKLGLSHESEGTGSTRQLKVWIRCVPELTTRTQVKDANEVPSASPTTLCVDDDENADAGVTVLESRFAGLQGIDNDSPSYTTKEAEEEGETASLPEEECVKAPELTSQAQKQLQDYRELMQQKHAKAKESQVKSKSSKSKGKPKQKKPRGEGNIAENGDDIDKVLQSLESDDSVCAKCKKPAGVLGRRCRFCCMQYCHFHVMAEAHGCDDAVKAHARREWIDQQNRESYQERKHAEIRHDKLSQVLSRKLGEAAGARAAQPSKGSGSGGSSSGRNSTRRKPSGRRPK